MSGETPQSIPYGSPNEVFNTANVPQAYRQPVLTLDGLILLILLILLDSLQVFSYTGQDKLNTGPYLLSKSI